MLPRTPAPKTTESLLGYTLRLSETNGYDTPWHILSYGAFDQGEMQTAGFPVEKLAAILGREASTLAHIAYCAEDPGGRNFKILNHSLGASMKDSWLRLAKPEFCPRCADEDGYVDAFWDLSQAVACPKHGCRPLGICPSCGKRLRWFRPGVVECRCGANLADTALPPANGLLVQLMAVMKAKLHGASAVTLQNSAGFPLEAIDRMSFKAFLGMIGGLGTFGLVTHGATEEHDTYRAMEQAALALADWPSGYHAFLRRLGAILKQERPKAIGLRKQFARFYESMFKGRSSALEMAFLREEFVNFGQSEWGEAIVDRKLLRDHMASDSRFQSISRTAREAGVRPVTLKSWADKGLVPINACNAEGGPHRYVIDKNAAALSRQTPGRIFEARRAAAYVNLPVSVLVGLKESGHYATDNRPRHKPGFHEADLDLLCQRILQRAMFVEQVPGNVPVVSLHYVLQEVCFWSKGGKASFVAAYLDSKTEAVGRTGESWTELFFRKADVEAHSKRCRAAFSEDAISQQEAADQLRCGLDVIAGLLAQGILTKHPGPDRVRVATDSVTLFAAEYIGLAQLARDNGTSARRLARLCASSEITMLGIARSSGSVAKFLRRNDVESLGPIKPRRSKSPADRIEKGRVSKLRRYLDGLRASGAPLPRRAGQPNRKAIAAACGIDRNALYDNQVAALLAEFEDEDCRRHQIAHREKPAALLRRYLDASKRSGINLPRGAGGRLSRVKIATACGFSRDCFYSDPEVRALLASIEPS